MSNNQQKRCRNDQWHPSLLPGSAQSNVATEQATAWLKWLVHSAAVANERLFSEPMVLGMPMILGTAGEFLSDTDMQPAHPLSNDVPANKRHGIACITWDSKGSFFWSEGDRRDCSESTRGIPAD